MAHFLIGRSHSLRKKNRNRSARKSDIDGDIDQLNLEDDQKRTTSNWDKLPSPIRICLLYSAIGVLAGLGGFIFHLCEWDQMQTDIINYKKLQDERQSRFDQTQIELLDKWDEVSHTFYENNMWLLRYSAFFSTTIFTTIGYGLQAPKTPMGHLFTCIYGLTSIPLYGYLAQLIGGIWIDLIGSGFQKLLGKKNWRRFSMIIYPTTILFVFAILAAVIRQSATDEGFGKGIDSFWAALYFLWITTSTIGYGDVMMSGSKPIPTLFLGLWISSSMGMALQLFNKMNFHSDQHVDELQTPLHENQTTVIRPGPIKLEPTKLEKVIVHEKIGIIEDVIKLEDA